MAAPTVHIIPRWVFANDHHGSYKDAISRARFLQRAGDYRQVLIGGDSPAELESALQGVEKAFFLVEYSTSPKIVRWLRERFSDSVIAVRAINLEPLQHLDNVGWWPAKGPVWTAYGMARIAMADIACKRFADVILSINEWENEVYWNRLPGKARVAWLPYHCPEHLLPGENAGHGDRKQIVCLPPNRQDRKSVDLVQRFLRFAETAQSLQPDAFDFLVTGQLEGWGLPESSVVRQVGLVDDLVDLLARSRAVCMLSPLGYGFRTTIGDAFAHDCVALAHPRLLARMPRMLRDAAIPVDSEDSASIAAALEALKAPVPRASLDAQLRGMNERMLASYL